MSEQTSRLDAYRRIATGSAYPALGLLWGVYTLQFGGILRSRLQHVSVAGMRLGDRPCTSPQCDFSTFWLAGVLARTGHADQVYNVASFQAVRQATFFPGVNVLAWLNPPPALLAVWPVSYLPFESAFYVWTLGLTAIAVFLLRAAALPWGVIAAGLLCPAALESLELGQFGAVTGGVLVAGLLLADRAPSRAGAILALLAIKPQSGLLAAVAMVAGGKWRVVAACAVTAAFLAAAVTLRFGITVWHGYLTGGLAASKMMLELPPDASGSEKFGVSVFWMLRSLGAGLHLAYAAQAVAACLAGITTWVMCRRMRFTALETAALTVFLSLLATPYGYVGDMVGWSIALAALAQARGWRIDLFDVLFWVWPALCAGVQMKTGILFTPVIVALAIARTCYRAAARPQSA
jgi:hypothetical protein